MSREDLCIQLRDKTMSDVFTSYPFYMGNNNRSNHNSELIGDQLAQVQNIFQDQDTYTDMQFTDIRISVEQVLNDTPTEMQMARRHTIIVPNSLYINLGPMKFKTIAGRDLRFHNEHRNVVSNILNTIKAVKEENE